MTKNQLKYLLKVLERVQPRDEHIEKAISYVDKDLAEYAARKGQMKDMYEADFTGL